MQSEEEGMRIAFQEANWRIIAGTAAQAITGDILVSAGNGSTRDSQIAPGVIVNADVNASAAIAQTKLGATTGFSVKASGASATTSAEPIVTYSASSNMSAERVTTASTSITINTGVASQIAFERAALTGDVTAAANSNTTAIAAGVIIDADVNAAAAIALTKTGAMTGDVTKASGSDASVIANDAVTTVKILNANVTLPKLATQAARTVVSNNTLSTATPTAVLHTDIIIRPDLLDCFVGGNSSTTLPMSALGWLYRDIAGTGSVARDSGTGFGGVYRITTGAVANNACSFTLGSTSTLPILNPINYKYTEFVIDLSSTTNTRLQVGYMQNSDTATTGGTACCMFMFDTSVSANWITTTRTASTSTQKTSGTAVTTVIVKLGIATDFSGPTVRFYVNDSLIATHTAVENVPNTEMNIGVRTETLTAGTRSCEISRFTAIRRLDGRDIPEV
jgi:hypothetical protein